MLLAGVAQVGIGLGGGGAVGAEGEVAGAAAADHAPAIVIAHDAVAAQMVGVQVQQVVALAGDDLPYGDGLPGEEVGAAAGDGVAAVDAAGCLWALWRRGGGVFVGEGQTFGLQGFGPEAGLDAIFVRAGAGAPGVAVGEQQPASGGLLGDDEDDGWFVPIYHPRFMTLPRSLFFAKRIAPNDKQNYYRLSRIPFIDEELPTYLFENHLGGRNQQHPIS